MPIEPRTFRDLAILLTLTGVMWSGHAALVGDLDPWPVLGYDVLLAGFAALAYWRGRTLTPELP